MCFRLVTVSCVLMSLGATASAQDLFSLDLEALGPASALDDSFAQDDRVESLELALVLDEDYVPNTAPLTDLELGLDDLAQPFDGGGVMRNEDVLEMTRAQFSDGTIKAVIAANATAFDVTPRALVALKSEGVSELVIETMLTIETEKRAASATTEPASAGPAMAETLPADSIAMLSQAIERLAAAPVPAAPAAPETPEVPAPGGGAGTEPRAWILDAGGRTVLTPSVADVAFTDSKSTGATALRTLEGLSSRKALVFASPALAVANEIGGLFRSGDPTTTAVWALPSATAARTLAADVVLELEFAGIPGVNPDEYRPAVVQLVPTIDNFRLVGAARTKVSDLDAGTPTEPIIEETIAARIDRLERGRYRITLGGKLPAGEYALVLRPLERKPKRRGGPASLGELLGAGASQILYLTWDFSVVPPIVAAH